MSEFKGFGRSNDIDFGDYVQIEQHRFNVPNDIYLYKVIGALESNTYMDAPIKVTDEESIHNGMEKVLRVIRCGIDETKVVTVAEKYCKKVKY